MIGKRGGKWRMIEGVERRVISFMSFSLVHEMERWRIESHMLSRTATDILAPNHPPIKLNKSAALKADAKEGSKAPSNGGILPTPSMTSAKMAPAASGSVSAAAAGPLSGMDAAKYEAVNINKQKKDAFQILKPDLDVNPEENPFFDPRMESIRRAQARELRARSAASKGKAEPNINPNLIEVSEESSQRKEKPKDPIPEVEDVPLLHSNSYPDATEANETDQILKVEKITIYVEHPRPIEPPAEPAPPPPQPLKLTKKEQKKLRTQRRLAKEKERQEMIRQGLLEPPKPKVKMSNLMRVLGSEATQDPTRLEMEIRAAAAEREQAHVDRNIARKLTPAERREQKERKLFDDPTTLETIVSIYKVNDLSHPQNRFKVDVNSQENRLSGCLVIFEGFCVVVVEGGTKSIKRYGKLMLRRINWAAKVENEDGEQEDDEEKPANKCVLVWQGRSQNQASANFLSMNAEPRLQRARSARDFEYSLILLTR
ncbi:RDM16-like protein [Drosera capensis]